MEKLNRLEKMSSEDLAKAQEVLDALCQKVDLQSWKITARKAKWKELCLRMAGVPALNPKKPGKKSLSEQKVDEIGCAVDVYLDFCTIDEDGNEVETPSQTKEDVFKVIAEMKGIEPKVRPSGKTSSPKEIVRGIYYNRYKKEYPERERIYRDNYSEDDGS